MPKDRPHTNHRWIPELIGKAGDPRLAAIAEAMANESDRGCAVFGAEVLNTELESLLRTFCVQDPASVKTIVNPLFRGYAPLATFSARIDVSFAFGLIPQRVRREIDLVRRLRNDFAHEPGIISFVSPACHARLQLLIGSPSLIEQECPPNVRDLLEHLRAQDESNFRRAVYVHKILYLAGYIAGSREVHAVHRGQLPRQPIEPAGTPPPGDT